MAIKTKAQLINDVINQIVTNTTGQITAQKVRTILVDMIDSLSINVSSSGFTVVNRGALGVDSTQANTIQYNSAGNIFYVDGSNTVYSHTPPNLQQVTDLGNTTTNSIGARDIYIYNANGQYSVLKSLAASGNYTVNLPAKSGTVAFLDDLNGASAATLITLTADGTIDANSPLNFTKAGGSLIDVQPGETMQIHGLAVVTKDVTGMEFFTAPFYATVSRSQDGSTLSLHAMNVLFTQQTGAFTPANTVQIIVYKPDETRFTFRLVCNNGSVIPVHGKIEAQINRLMSYGYIPPAPVTYLSVNKVQTPSAEGDDTMYNFVFEITRSGDLTTAFSVDWLVTGFYQDSATNDDFYGNIMPSGTVQFGANDVTKQVSVAIAPDYYNEVNEKFMFTVSNVSISAQFLTGNSVECTIVNDDAQPLIDIVSINATKQEPDTGWVGYQFNVTRSGNLKVSSNMSWGVTGYGANPVDASDFYDGVLPSGILVFGVDETVKTITVKVKGDVDFEGDEAFMVSLFDPANCTLNTSYATGYIQNNDSSPTPIIDVAFTSGAPAEGDSSAQTYIFTVTRSGVENTQIHFDYIVDYTGLVTPADYNDFGGGNPQGTIVMEAFENTKEIQIFVFGDTDYEFDELFNLRLTNPTNCTIRNAVATATIFNDDPEVLATIDAYAAPQNIQPETEGPKLYVLTAYRKGNLTSSCSVDYSVSGIGYNPANVGDTWDGNWSSGTLTFDPGQQWQYVYFYISGDTVVENDETFAMTLSNPVNATIGNPTAVYVIQNDDVAVVSEILDFTSAASVSSNGVTATISEASSVVKFGFNPIVGGTGTPMTFEIRVYGVAFMNVDMITDYIGQPFTITYTNGNTYSGIIKSDFVDFVYI